MELTEDMLRRIANNLGSLKLRLDLLQQLLTQRGEKFEEFEELEREADSPELRRICDEIFEQLKGDH
jgi:hypothetical protein